MFFAGCPTRLLSGMRHQKPYIAATKGTPITDLGAEIREREPLRRATREDECIAQRGHVSNGKMEMG